MCLDQVGEAQTGKHNGSIDGKCVFYCMIQFDMSMIRSGRATVRNTFAKHGNTCLS